MTRIHIGVPLTVGLGVLLAVAACGTSTPSTTSASGSSPFTVSVHSIGNQPVLVDQAGAALYTNDQETGQPRCVSSDCMAIWTPLTVSNGAKPTAGSGVTGTLATVRRPDGSQQVTLNGKPLYTFSFDHGAGRVTGNGTRDSFAGTNYTWHSALSSGQPAAPAPTSGGGGNSGGGYSGGGGGYGGGY